MAAPDLDRLAAILAEVAETEILPRWRNLAAHEIQEKTGPNDLVTVADEASERVLARRLPDLVPGSVVVGEEAVEKDPRLLDLIAGDRPVWIVDPVDGTKNFAEGKERFCVMAALAHNGHTIAAAIHEPVSGRTALAGKGDGAELVTPDSRRRLRLGTPTGLGAMQGALNIRFLPPGARQATRARADRLMAGRHHRRGCAGHEYLELVSGAWDFSFYWKNMPWDHAPGLLIHGEAGGYNARLNGRPYRPGERRGGVLAAADPEHWRLLRTGVLGLIDT